MAANMPFPRMPPHNLGAEESLGTPIISLVRGLMSDTDGCVIWRHEITPGGYGRIYLDGRRHLVHALACELVHGSRPEDMVAAHQPVACHNRACFNPRHLRWATRSENQQDRHLDDTSPVGERNRRAKLSADDVLQIRASYAAGGVSQGELGRRFGVTQTLVGQIVRRKIWSHI